MQIRILSPLRLPSALVRGALLTGALLLSACSGESPVATTDEGVPGEAVLAGRVGPACELGVEPGLAIQIVESLAAGVEALTETEALAGGDARSTLRHLENALRSLSQGQACPARAQIEAFRHQVEELRRRGVLDDREMAPLLMSVRLLLGGEPLHGDPETMYAPGAFGEVRTIPFGGEDFTYEVLDGLAIFQSDMILGYADEFEAGAASTAPAAEASQGPDGPQRSGVCYFYHFTCERWHDQTIGYGFADDWGSPSVNADMRSRIMQAVNHWNNFTGMRLVPRSGGERVVFQNSTGCSSNVGRRVVTGDAPQGINVSTTCGVGAIIHEIGHAVGLYHEQSRNDRNAFVQVFLENVMPGREHNFTTFGGAGFEVGDYDHGSLMHYGCGFFRADGAGNTIAPMTPGVTCADLGGNGLTPTDILGVYTLYPPDFHITGASPGETGDRFTLEATFTTKPVRDEWMIWTSDRVPGWWATGKTASTGAAALPPGDHRITAHIIVAGVEVLTRSISIRIFGHPPEVDLGPDRDVDLNRLFFVSPTVTDVEDGACPLTVCRYTWSPTPETDGGGAAGYRFTEEGPRTLRVTVRDGSGRTTTDEVTVQVVNSPPVPVIGEPAHGSSYLAGQVIGLAGHQLDINEGPDPGPGRTTCRLTWSSSDASDVVDWGFRSWAGSCGGTITFGDPGTRTLRLTARDPEGLTASTEVEVTVVGCAGDCAPLPHIVLTPTPELDGSSFSPTFTGPGYYLDTEIGLGGDIYEADDPPDNPIAYEWRVRLPCFAATCPADRVLDSGTVEAPGAGVRVSTFFRWTPADDLAPWDHCVTTALPVTIRLQVTDSRGASNTTSREVHLACRLF